ncbi:hypothetical protein JST97_29845 [bacterium]|nr:hypothetical protein [bacterium]
MKRVLLAVLALLLVFLVAGSGVYRYLGSRDRRPFLKAEPSALAGRWQNKAATIKIEAAGAELKVDDVTYVRDGQAPRWVEKEPKSNVPRALEFDGTSLKLTSYSDAGRSEAVFERAR